MGDVHDLLQQFDSLHARVKTLQDHVGSPAKSSPTAVDADSRNLETPQSGQAEASPSVFPPTSDHEKSNGAGSPGAIDELEEKIRRLESENAALQRQLREKQTVEELIHKFEAHCEDEREDRHLLFDKIEDLDHAVDRLQSQQVQQQREPPSPLGERASLQDFQALASRMEKRIETLGESLERSTTAMQVAMEREAQRHVKPASAPSTQARGAARKSDTSEEPPQKPTNAKGLEWTELFNADNLEITITPGAATPADEQEEATEAGATCGCFGEKRREEVKGWFRIQCKHSSSSWVAVHAASEFLILHLQLKEQAMRRRISMEAHHFPKRQFIAAATDKQTKALCLSLERYLSQLARMPEVASHHLFLQFLQVSAATLQKGFEPCMLEGAVAKSTGSAVSAGGCCSVSCSLSFGGQRKQNQRWFVLKDSCLFYMHSPLFFQPKGVMLFDRDCTLSPDPTTLHDGRLWHKVVHKIEFRNSGRSLTLHFKRTHHARRWLMAIHKAMTLSPYCSKENRFRSFAPERPKCQMQWYLNGCAYFDAVAEAIDEARREVFIAGWFLSPHVYLRRPSRDNEHWRLDKLLQRKAAQGVKVYVLIFRELEVCLEANNSHFAKQVLRGLHSNIFVLRSPHDIAITYHSHHEKLVVTDSGAGCAFVGGIDLAFGRWDTSAHLLSDAGEMLFWPGKDYCNEGYCATKGTDLPFLDLMDRGSEPRMPWHDFAVKVCGDAAFDVARHFIARWNKRTYNERDGQYVQLIPELPLTAEDFFEPGAQPLKSLARSSNGSGERNSFLRAERMSARGWESRNSVSSSSMSLLRRARDGSNAMIDSRYVTTSSSDSRRHISLTRKESRRHLKVPPSSGGSTLSDVTPPSSGQLQDMARAVSSGRSFGTEWSVLESEHVFVTGEGFGAGDDRATGEDMPTVAQPDSVDDDGQNGPPSQPESGDLRSESRRNSLRSCLKSVDFDISDLQAPGSNADATLVPPPALRTRERSNSRSPLSSTRDANRASGGRMLRKTGSFGRNPQGPPALGSRSISEPLSDLPALAPLSSTRIDSHLSHISEEHSFRDTSLSAHSQGSDSDAQSKPRRSHDGLRPREMSRTSSGSSAGRAGSGVGELLSVGSAMRRLSQQPSNSDLFFLGGARPQSTNSFRRPTSSAFPGFDQDLSHIRQSLLSDVGMEEECTCQVVRSIDKWSGDLGNERSIEEAYVRLIQGAQHYVHIENQFFVSACEGSDEVENRVTKAIKDRIIQEINNEKRNKVSSKFRVVVILPLLPGLPGSPQVNASKRMLLHLQYQTICRNNGASLLEKLREVTDTPEKYIGFYGLRQWGRMPDHLVRQEQIYIHGKLMIVDDRHILCGSANINDRSLLGKNDSEVAVVMTDSEHRVQSKMFGKTWEAFRAARDMRVRLYSMHLGAAANAVDLSDPCSPEMIARWQQASERNTQVYRELFMCFPDDQVRSWESYEEWEVLQEEKLDDQEHDGGVHVEEKLSTVNGHLVQFPLRFLEDEDLCPTWTEKEYHVDRRVFT